MAIPAKITQLMTNTEAWPLGTVAAIAALRRRGYSNELIGKYRKSGWLLSVGRGAVARQGDKVGWTGGLWALQHHLGLDVHVGGKTALQWHGHFHFVPAREGGLVTLFGRPGTKLPKWFVDHPWEVRPQYFTTDLFGQNSSLGLSEGPLQGLDLKVSSRERAVLEMLHLLPRQQSFEEAALLLDQLDTLRPDLVKELLLHCRSIKVKRLFLFLSKHAHHPWAEKLDPSQFNLGKGKRQIVPGGMLEPEFQITVPEAFISGQNEENRP